MKTKNKMIALMEIAIVLCSLFFMALPAIATEQTTQEANATTITTASEDDYVLDIYGNANEDDTIDMRDLTYVKLIFFGKKPETALADAKYDGKINPLDFIQIKLIIVGKEKELTIVCDPPYGKDVTIHKPVKRIVVLLPWCAEYLQVLNAVDMVVGGSNTFARRPLSFPKLSKLPDVGKASDPDCEEILNLNPDIVFQIGMWSPELEDKLEGTDIKVVRLDFYIASSLRENLKKLGYILDRKKEAEEFIDFYEGHLDAINKRVETLSEDDKPRVYIEGCKKYVTSSKKSTGSHDLCILAGGRNIAYDGEKFIGPDVDPEWVLEQNPDVIIKSISSYYLTCGYDKGGDPSDMKALRDSILDRPELAKVYAVKNKKVYVICWDIEQTAYFVGASYYAKWLHPDLFEDLDPQAIHQEYIDRFRHINFDVKKQGVFVYPPLED